MLTISPLPNHRVAKTPIGVLREDGRIVGESGATLLYCGSVNPALRMVKQYGGKALIVRTRGSTRWVRFKVGEAEIIPGVATPDIEQLILFRDYCHSLGIRAASLQAMGFNLMRYSLAGYFEVDTGSEIPFSKFPPGARIHSQFGIWTNAVQLDITAAYLWAIGRFSPARSHSEFRRISLKDICENPGSWALVSFKIRQNKIHGALPELSDGVTVYPSMVSGWSEKTLLSSYDLSTEHDSDIRIHKAWINNLINTPFSAFMYLMAELRNSKFGKVAKQAGNTLWGSFSSNGESAIIEFVPGRNKNKVFKLPQRDALCLPIGYSVLSSVRARLFSEGMNSIAFPSIVFHAHTDGFITKARRLKDVSPMTNEIGGWRVVDFFDKVEVLGPTWYSTHKGGKITYKIAGRNSKSENAYRLFAHHRERVLNDPQSE